MITEDLGLAKIHRECALMSAIWRPTSSHDLGIDGQIEFLNEGTVISTGLILAVQSKSGTSYFESVDENDVLYYPALKHRTYIASAHASAFRGNLLTDPMVRVVSTRRPSTFRVT